MNKPKNAKPARSPRTEQLIADTLALTLVCDRTEEYGDCHLWTGATTERGYPIHKLAGHPCQLVRRTVFRLCGGVLVPRQPVDVRCGEVRCLNPEHMFQSSTKAVAKKAAKRGAWSGLARAAKISASRRKGANIKLDEARAALIRNSEESGPVLAARHGINKSLANNIKRGAAWKDYSNPYLQLMA